MLRSTTTPNRTRVQPRPDMKHEATRHFTPTFSASPAGGVDRLRHHKNHLERLRCSLVLGLAACLC